MGSLLPLSNSSIGLSLCRSPMPDVLRMENTDAESVDDMMEANSSDSSHPKAYSGISHCMSSWINTPVNIVVSNTPTVANTSPGASTGRILPKSVSNPPENNITHSEIIPINSAVDALSNCMPNPSTPASMPMPRNASSDGSPYLLPALPKNTLKKSSMAMTSIMLPGVISI